MGDAPRHHRHRSFGSRDLENSGSDASGYFEDNDRDDGTREWDSRADSYSVRSDDPVPSKIERSGSVGYSKPGKKDPIGALLKLMDMMEEQGGRDDDDRSYSDEDADSHLMKKGYDNEFFDDMSTRQPPSVTKTYMSEEEEELEYTAAPFYVHDEETGDFQEDEDGNPIYPAELDDQKHKIEKKFKQQRKMNWLGSLVFLIYLVAFCFYMWIRVTKTLDLGQFVAYGIAILVIEIMGATATVIYGLNLILMPVYEKFPDDPQNPGRPLVDVPYHIRVLIPCYKEPLEIVGRTATAALDAELPRTCQRTVYLLDDGKDPAKRKWCMQMGAEMVYVSGRRRAPGEMNGKSANLNNCMRQIYPEGVPIPLNEMVCIFDADQVANPDFFLKTVPLFDAGDDVGMVLSPQAYHNLKQHADIFNHANVHFWEYAQPGYDALGFISCTGTNFLTRSCAFREAGWSPEYTLTEDFALGMELKKRKYHCRYVEEYLAVGEAPDQVRNCFQQRSRWCKGHFQIMLSRRHCPLFQRGLSFFQRMMYCTGVWSYIVGAVTTPTYILIPILTVWAGIFPIVVSQWAALGLTVYFVAQTLVLSYTKKWKHMEALWFASISNSILWFTYVKACWRAAMSSCGSSLTFKTTLKGAGKLMNTALGDLWMPGACLIVLLVTLGFGIAKLVQGQTIITTLSISVVWLIYAAIPPFLICWYTLAGRGTTLQFWCRIMFILSYAAAICAIALLWAVYPPVYDFGKAAGDSLRFLDAQRVGSLPASNSIPWRGNSLLYENATKLNPAFKDLTGGWMQGGHAGTLKLTMPAAFTTTMLAWGMLAFPAAYQKAGEMEHATDTLRWGTDYLLKLYTPASSTNTTKTAHQYQIIYQLGNLTQDTQYWGTPENMTAARFPRPAFNISTAQGASDLAGQMAAAFASAAVVFKKSDPAYHYRLADAADEMYAAATKNLGSFTDSFPYNCVSQYAKQYIGKKTSNNTCSTPSDFNGGSALVYYNSTSYYDDLFWAAGWMYYMTNDASYIEEAGVWYGDHLSDMDESEQDEQIITDYDHVFWAGNVLWANLTDQGAFHTQAQDYLRQWICGSTNIIQYTIKGRGWNPYSPSLGTTANTAFLALTYAEQKTSFISAAKANKYVCWARTQMRYVLGGSGRSLLVGWGKNPPTHAQNRAASCPSQTGTCGFADYYAPAPNPHVITGGMVQQDAFGDRFDDIRDTNNTIVSLDTNAAVPGSLAGLHIAPGTWEQCLQGYGQLLHLNAACQTGL